MYRPLGIGMMLILLEGLGVSDGMAPAVGPMSDDVGFVGKPPQNLTDLAWSSEPPRRTPSPDSGKPPSPIAFDGEPPRGPGPGLRFDTRRFFYVYTDKGASANHFVPSGWMGDHGDIRFDDANRADPADGQTCIQITYLGRGSNRHEWAGMYWQEPRGNWGDRSGGYDLSGMKRLTFWVRGSAGGEQIAVFKVGGIVGRHPDSGAASIGPVVLSNRWEQYTIDLSDTDLKKVSGGFALSVDRFANAGPISFYLDEIRYER